MTLTDLLANMFPEIDFKKETKLVEDGFLDSLNLFRLITCLEQEYKITIPVEELSAENFNSLSAIYSLLQRLCDK